MTGTENDALYNCHRPCVLFLTEKYIGTLAEGPLTFRFSIVGSGNCPIYASGGQLDALLAPAP